MAVHTKLSNKEILDILQEYNLGNLLEFHGIKEGIENTNYLIKTDKDKVVLTIFENRVKQNEIPFFLDLMEHTNQKGIKCPIPIINKKNLVINSIKNKKYSIFSFINGKSKKKWNEKECFLVGKMLGNFHTINRNFKRKKKNNFGHYSWNNIFNKCTKKINKVIPDSYELIKKEIDFVISNWPKDLPKGIIHADLFPDNVFFLNKNISGILDFYFSCYDFFSYDLAIVINAWCFVDQDFNYKFSKEIIRGYESSRKLKKNEKENFNIFLRGATLRFLLTRIYDSIFINKKTFHDPKNPFEFFTRLKFHSKLKDGDFF